MDTFLVFNLLIVVLHISASEQIGVETSSGVGDQPEWAKPTEDDVRKTLQEACRKNAEADDAFEKAIMGTQDFKICSLTHFGGKAFAELMEKAQNSDSPELLFKEICLQSPDLKICTYNYAFAVQPCFDEDERKNKPSIPIFINAFTDSYCTSASRKMALFIADGVPECARSKEQEINACFTSAIGYVPIAKNSIQKLVNFLLNSTESCRNLQNLRNCLLTELMTCDKPTTAHVIDYIFEFVPRRRQCPANLKYFSVAKSGPANKASLYGLITISLLGFCLNWLSVR